MHRSNSKTVVNDPIVNLFSLDPINKQWYSNLPTVVTAPLDVFDCLGFHKITRQTGDGNDEHRTVPHNE